MQSCELVTTAIWGNCSLIDFFWSVVAVLFDQFEIEIFLSVWLKIGYNVCAWGTYDVNVY